MGSELVRAASALAMSDRAVRSCTDSTGAAVRRVRGGEVGGNLGRGGGFFWGGEERRFWRERPKRVGVGGGAELVEGSTKWSSVFTVGVVVLE